jgi:Glycosyltransferase family 87
MTLHRVSSALRSRLPPRAFPAGLDPLRDAGIVAAFAFAISVALGLAPVGTDDNVYWLTGHTDPLYRLAYVWPGYFYSPAFAQVLAPFTLLPLTVFGALWKLLLAGAVFVLARRWAVVAFVIPFVAAEMFAGNVNLLIAAAIVLGFRWPGAWAVVLLTKVSPGVGLVWFAVRREWRSLAIALGTTVLVAAASFALAPSLWFDWVDVLRANVQTASSSDAIGAGPVTLRVAVALVVVAWGAWTNRRWTVPVAATIALPVIYVGGLSILLASIPLYLQPRAAVPAQAVPGGDPARPATRGMAKDGGGSSAE